MTQFYYLNGKVVPASRAKISINDIGILRGFGAFDFFRVYDGKPFLLDEHYKRLKRSLEQLGLSVPITEKGLETAVINLVLKNKLKNATFRIVVTGGESEDGLTFNSATPTVFMRPHKLPSYPSESFTKGVKLIAYEHQRELPGAKTINYPTMMKLQKTKKASGAMEILYTSKGQVLEGSACNFFIFKKNTLVTAKDNILLGTRRKVVLGLAKKKFKIEEREMKISELKSATEAFITSTTKDVMPVVQIDNKTIGDGRVGQNTQYLMDEFKKFVRRSL